MVLRQTEIDGKQIADCVAKFRARRPHVHCITNSVAQHFIANVLLATGATPSMTINAGEVADFVGMADALLINLGTMDEQRGEAIEIAVDTAVQLGTPWALDPVFVDGSPFRLEQAKTLLEKRPSLVRCNASELKALFGIEADTGKTCECAIELETTIALTGLSDTICNRQGVLCVDNGSPQMANITAMGCALTAVMAGFMSLDDDPLLLATSAVAFFALVGDVAEQNSIGPGSFVPAFLDALHNLTVGEIASGVRLS